MNPKDLTHQQLADMVYDLWHWEPINGVDRALVEPLTDSRSYARNEKVLICRLHDKYKPTPPQAIP